MGGLLPKAPKVKQPDPPPQIDQALQMARNNAGQRKRGLGTTLLTGDAGLPNLGSSSRPKTYGA